MFFLPMVGPDGGTKVLVVNIALYICKYLSTKPSLVLWGRLFGVLGCGLGTGCCGAVWVPGGAACGSGGTGTRAQGRGGGALGSLNKTKTIGCSCSFHFLTLNGSSCDTCGVVLAICPCRAVCINCTVLF